MNDLMIPLLIFGTGVALSYGAWRLLRRFDPEKTPGESRFEGVLPNARGLASFAATMLLVIGLILALMIAPMIYFT